MAPLNVLSNGAGIQSSTIIGMVLKGELPMLHAWVFADTRYEPKKVYRHLEVLKEASAKAGIKFYCVTAGNLRQDAIEFRQNRKLADGKRYASIPVFVKNPDGSQGRVKRQCTKEYKIIPVERVIRRDIIGLGHGQVAPKKIVVEQWMGISADEGQRAKPPGRWSRKRTHRQSIMFGQPEDRFNKVWNGIPWKTHVYPLLGVRLFGDRRSGMLKWGNPDMTRQDCVAWLKRAFPQWDVPRSACLCCPFRSNDEWRLMKEEDPEGWEDAVRFDYEMRERDEAGMKSRMKKLVGIPFLHRQLVPLDMADLEGPSEPGAGCGSSGDEYSFGMCGV